MASAHLSLSRKLDWPLANPWLWLVSGLVLCVWSWLWTLAFEAASSDMRIVVLAIGLLLAGVGVWQRLSDRTSVYLYPLLEKLAFPLRLALGGVCALMAVGVTVLFISTFFVGDAIGWRWPATLLVWLSAAPLFFCAAKRTLARRSASQPTLDAEEEMGLASVLAAACAFAGSWTLYVPSEPYDWDTLRLVLRVATALAMGGAGLVLVSSRVRRAVISFLVVLHFAGIATACLSAPPAPWLVQQTWMRVFRPYLEFMYLNNAYHFYAPEPGPASHLWFRLIYTDEAGKDQGMWFKVPDIDEKGRHRHSVALEYQRHLAMCESVAGSDTPPAWVFTNEFGILDVNPMYKNRLNLDPAMQAPMMMPAMKLRHPRVPLHPLIPQTMQVRIPNEGSRRLLASYARFAAHKFEQLPEHPAWKFKSVKVYWVVHWVPSVDWYVAHLEPTDPILYRPFYVGNYDADGKILDADWSDRDPYLYWLLPILRTNMNDPKSEVKDYCRLHAGDSHWVRPAGKTAWVDPNE